MSQWRSAVLRTRPGEPEPWSTQNSPLRSVRIRPGSSSPEEAAPLPPCSVWLSAEGPDPDWIGSWENWVTEGHASETGPVWSSLIPESFHTFTELPAVPTQTAQTGPRVLLSRFYLTFRRIRRSAGLVQHPAQVLHKQQGTRTLPEPQIPPAYRIKPIRPAGPAGGSAEPEPWRWSTLTSILSPCWWGWVQQGFRSLCEYISICLQQISDLLFFFFRLKRFQKMTNKTWNCLIFNVGDES